MKHKLLPGEIFARIADFAARAHAGQFRKDKVTPYIVHPARVGQLAAMYGGSSVEVYVAWLHDVIEDTPVTGEELKQFIIGIFCEGWTDKERQSKDFYQIQKAERILKCVNFLTDDKREGEIRRDRKKRIIERFVILAPPEARFLKLCDRCDNLTNVEALGDFAGRYLKETQEFLDGLRAVIREDDVNRDILCNRKAQALFNDLERFLKSVREKNDK